MKFAIIERRDKRRVLFKRIASWSINALFCVGISTKKFAYVSVC